MHALSFVLEPQPGFLKRKVEKERGKTEKDGNEWESTRGNGRQQEKTQPANASSPKQENQPKTQTTKTPRAQTNRLRHQFTADSGKCSC